jgi:hypothetical protein
MATSISSTSESSCVRQLSALSASHQHGGGGGGGGGGNRKRNERDEEKKNEKTPKKRKRRQSKEAKARRNDIKNDKKKQSARASPATLPTDDDEKKGVEEKAKTAEERIAELEHRVATLQSWGDAGWQSMKNAKWAREGAEARAAQSERRRLDEKKKRLTSWRAMEAQSEQYLLNRVTSGIHETRALQQLHHDLDNVTDHNRSVSFFLFLFLSCFCVCCFFLFVFSSLFLGQPTLSSLK